MSPKWKWNYRLNKANKEGYTDNITDLKPVYITEGMIEITVPSTINGVAVTEIGSFSIIEIEDKAGNKKKVGCKIN